MTEQQERLPVLDNISILSMRVCAARHDNSVTGAEFIGLLSSLVEACVCEALEDSQGLKIVVENFENKIVRVHDDVWDLRDLDGEDDETPAEDSAAPSAAAVLPTVLSHESAGAATGEAASPNRRGGPSKLTDAQRELLRTNYGVVTNNGANRPPPNWVKDRAAELGVSGATVYDVLRNGSPAPARKDTQGLLNRLQTPAPRADRYKVRRVRGTYGEQG